MINYLVGTIKKIHEKSVTILVNGLGFHCHIPQAQKLKEGTSVELHSYLHWNQEKGPSLYGFHSELEKTTFLLIIECPKIGPSLALTILSQITAPQFLEIITTQNENALSALNGIGAKKAEQLITSLKHKVPKLLSSGEVVDAGQQDFIQWQNVNDVLVSLNYTRQEIGNTMQYLTKNFTDQNYSLDQLIRAALSHLTKQKNR